MLAGAPLTTAVGADCAEAEPALELPVTVTASVLPTSAESTV